MANNVQQSWIKESFNGRGWENSLEISSVEELRSKLLELGASVSFDDDSYGITNANANVESRFITSKSNINSYRSYLTSDQYDTNFSHLHGNFNDLNVSYNGSPITFPLRSTTNSLNILRNELDPGEKGYIAFNINSTGMELDNGFMITPQAIPGGATNQVNPEIVFELNSEFWDDYQDFRNNIDNQKAIGNNIEFDVEGLGNAVDLSTIRFANDNSAIESIIDDFNFTLVTDQRWDLPLYGGGNITAKVELIDESNPSNRTNLDVHLKDHDFNGIQPPALQGFSGAIELTENGDGTVLEFGLDPGQLKNVIQEVQENWNSSSAYTFFEVQGISMNFNNLPSVGGGGTNPYHIYSDKVYSDQALTLKPVTTQTSDFSDFSDVGIKLTGDFNSVIDFWNIDNNRPDIQLTSEDGLTRYNDVNLTLNYEAVDESGERIAGKNLNIISSLHLLADHNNFNVHFNDNKYPDGVVDFKLTNINFNANPWNIQTASHTPAAALAGITPAAATALAAMSPAAAAALAAMNPADATALAAMYPPAEIAAMPPAAAAALLGVVDPAAIATITSADVAAIAAMDPADVAVITSMDPAAITAIKQAPAPAPGNTPINLNYHVNEAGDLVQTSQSYDKDGNPIEIDDYIDNVDDLMELKISNLNDLSHADKLNASVELTLNNDRLPWNVNYTGPEITDTLETYYSLQELDQLAVLGDSVKEESVYDLTITAKMLGDLRLEGAGLKIEFDNTLFKDLEASDIQLGSSFVKAYDDNKTGYGPIRVDNTNGEIYISAMSAEDLGWGRAISEESVFAKISLDFDEEELRKIDQNSDGSLKIQDEQLEFDIKASLDDTIFTEDYDDGSGLSNRKIQSLRELNKGITVKGRDVTLYDASINLEQQDNGLVLGTQRIIGSDSAFTNLIRSGDTLSTSATWLNVGNIEANNIKVQGIENDNAVLAGSSISKTSLKSGSFIDGKFDEAGREDLKLTADIEITGEAGEVLNLAEGILTVEAEGSQIFSNAGKGSSNLITFQGDLNYDGRVSMKDLAFLNAGAARQQSTAESSGEDADGNGIVDASLAQDVDADFNGKIDMADLTVLDQDWGNSLHTGTSQGFTGSSAHLTWETLDAQGGATWDNSSFKAQNAIEADDGYVGSLETTTGSSALGAASDSSGPDVATNNAFAPEDSLG